MSKNFTGVELVQLASRRRWSKANGWQTVMVWRGTLEQINLAVPLVQIDAQDVEIGGEPPYYELTATYGNPMDGSPAAQELATTWTLQGNDLEKSLWELPKVVAALAPLTGEDVAAHRKDVEVGLQEFSSPDSYGDQNPIFKGLYTEFLKGVTSFTIGQYVLRRTMVVPPGSDTKPVYTNVGKVFSTAMLQAAEAIPTTISFTLPPGEWLKRTPTVDQLGSGKFQISQEWWHADAWSTYIYESAT